MMRFLAPTVRISPSDLEFLRSFPFAPLSQLHHHSEHFCSSLRGLYWGSAFSRPFLFLLRAPVDGVQQGLRMLWILSSR